ncbi:MAG: sulfatase-like hydrolase/transferase [Tagaea sp.]|nr:sulfatase-like hydrolase/transferase [Tagaea sp.]
MTDGRRTPPNVLFVCVDQWPAGLLGCAGHAAIETPTLDALAAMGTRFTALHAETPICIPARRSMMTGTAPRRHGDREFQTALPMPADLPTLAATFRAHGYQAQAVGKLHVYPQRDRIGFDDAQLAEEGRGHLGATDDYEIFLADRGFAGRQFLHGMSNNEYDWRPWHLPEDTHVTNWITWAASRAIKRRDPTRPALWHVSYTHPHPPIVPLESYLARYRDRPVELPPMGDWARAPERLAHALRAARAYWPQLPPERHRDMLRAFYAQCTHIDHQLRVLIGTLREEDVLDDTVILVVADHGDMLGAHGLYAKRLMYDGSVRVPAILVRQAGAEPAPGRVDPRLAGLRDVMPTLLDACGLPIPETCDGLSLLGATVRETIYGESLTGAKATRMVRDARHKLIWYPAGNVFQLFDLTDDPHECVDRAGDASHASALERLKAALAKELYGEDAAFLRDGVLVGMADPPFSANPNRGLSGQRGLHFPSIPPTDAAKVVGAG